MLNNEEFVYQPSTKVYERMYDKLTDIFGKEKIIQVDEYPEGYYVRYFIKKILNTKYVFHKLDNQN